MHKLNLISDGGSDGDTAVISKANSGMYHVYINRTENERKKHDRNMKLYLNILSF